MLLTDPTTVGPCARMQRSVFTQIAAGGETFATYFTPERAWNLPPLFCRRFLCKNQEERGFPTSFGYFRFEPLLQENLKLAMFALRILENFDNSNSTTYWDPR